MDIRVLEGLTIDAIYGMDKGYAEITFRTTDGREFRMTHEQECCESVTLEDVIGDPNDLIGSPILRAEARTQAGDTDDYSESSTWTFYELATIQGSVTLRWFGVSNGYYSESVDFYEITNRN